MNRTNNANGRRGVAAVEFALTLPLLMVFVLGCVDFGRVIHSYIAVANAARAGSEYGAMHGFTPYTRSSWESQVEQVVMNEMETLENFSAGDLTIAIDTTTDSDGLFRVSVEVKYPFSTVVSWTGIPSDIDLWHRVEMRRIQ